MTLYAYPCIDEWLSSICTIVSYLYAFLSLYRILRVKSYSWILRARVGKTCFCLKFNLDMDRCLTWSTDLTNVWHGSSIYLLHDMIVSSVWCMTWSCHLPYAWPGRLFCHMFNSFTRAINHWYIRCMLSIYDMQPIIDVTGVWYDRWGALIRWSLHDVRWL